ncbi:MAG: hypothetical protein ACYDA1_01730, partial [Vulcanimicrobiaceae bacterium]
VLAGSILFRNVATLHAETDTIQRADALLSLSQRTYEQGILALQQRSRLLAPFCAEHAGLFQKAILLGGLPTELTGEIGVAPSPAPSNNALQPSTNTASQIASSLTSVAGIQPTVTPSPPPSLHPVSIGLNVTAPFLRIISALQELHQNDPDIGIALSSISHPSDTSDNVVATLTLTAQKLDTKYCSTLRSSFRSNLRNKR